MKKNYVLDTNVLLHNPESIKKFEDNDVFIPCQVIEELDKFKTEHSERGYSARRAIKNISSFREQGDLISGVRLDGGGNLYVLYEDPAKQKSENKVYLPEGFPYTKMDNLILLMTKILQNKSSDKTILVTNDANMRIKADIMKIESQDYLNDRLSPDQEIYKGRSVRYVSDDFLNKFCQDKEDTEHLTFPEEEKPTTNEFINLRTWQGASVLAKYNGRYLEKLRYSEITPHPCGLSPRNMGQKFLMEALLSDYKDHSLTIVNGPAGTGKTLFALGCGLHQVMEEKKYKRVLYCRANVTMDEDIGFLPGTEMSKIEPLLRGAYDNLEILFANPDDTPEMIQSKKDYLFDKGYIQAQAIAYLRGRSIANSYVIIDEAQNITPTQIMSIVTRASEHSKFILMGDPNQIDSPRLDYGNNGLVYALEHMKDEKICEIISFEESECTRSELARVASERLKR